MALLILTESPTAQRLSLAMPVLPFSNKPEGVFHLSLEAYDMQNAPFSLIQGLERQRA
jgi:hypothetical protein